MPNCSPIFVAIFPPPCTKIHLPPPSPLASGELFDDTSFWARAGIIATSFRKLFNLFSSSIMFPPIFITKSFCLPPPLMASGELFNSSTFLATTFCMLAIVNPILLNTASVLLNTSSFLNLKTVIPYCLISFSLASSYIFTSLFS